MTVLHYDIFYPVLSPGAEGRGSNGVILPKFQQTSSLDPDMLEINTLHRSKGLEVLYQNCEFHVPQGSRLPLGRGQSLL